MQVQRLWKCISRARDGAKKISGDVLLMCSHLIWPEIYEEWVYVTSVFLFDLDFD